MEKSRKDIDRILKDRGDNWKRNKVIKKDVKMRCDRGDSYRNRTCDRSSESDRKLEKNETPRSLEAPKRQSEYEKENKRIMEKRRKIRDTYTIKYLGPEANRPNAKDLSVDSKKDVPSILKQDQKLYLTKSDTKTSKTDKENQRNQKVPVIKTITSKNDSRVYKAVTFTTQKQNPVTALQINIPTPTVRTNYNRIPTMIKPKPKTPSKTSVKPISEKRIGRKRKRWHREESPVLKAGDSPQTEVAKWAPDCINKHTKPYYEAWINTTLAAISTDSKRKKYLNEELIKSFQLAMEREDSSELIYRDCKDERYIGRIKVNHK